MISKCFKIAGGTHNKLCTVGSREVNKLGGMVVDVDKEILMVIETRVMIRTRSLMKIRWRRIKVKKPTKYDPLVEAVETYEVTVAKQTNQLYVVSHG